MSNINENVIKDEIINDEKGITAIGEIFYQEDLVTVVEKISSDSTKYSYIEIYENENGTVILGASSKLSPDKIGNIMPERSNMGIWFYDNKFTNTFKEINSIIDNISKYDDPIEELEQFNSDLYYKKHILPDLFTSALVCRKNDYGNKGDNIFYIVEKKLSDGERVNLSFRYPTQSDFRIQLKNLFNSVINVNNLAKEYIKECGVCSSIEPSESEIAMFDSNSFMKNIKNNIKEKAKNKNNKEKVKQ